VVALATRATASRSRVRDRHSLPASLPPSEEWAQDASGCVWWCSAGALRRVWVEGHRMHPGGLRVSTPSVCPGMPMSHEDIPCTALTRRRTFHRTQTGH